MIATGRAGGRRTRRDLVRLTTTVLLAIACRSDVVGPLAGKPATVTVSAVIAGTAIQGLAVTVTGPGIATPIVANIPAEGSVASGTIEVPAGRDRRFVVQAFDAAAIQTHEGSATTSIRPGTNPTLNVALYPVTGGQPIVVTIGHYVLTLAPGDQSLAVGQTRQFTATVATDGGAPVASPALSWGSLNPVVASVDQNGFVTAAAEGTTDVVVAFAGSAAVAHLTVTAAAPPPPVALSCASPGGTAHAGSITASEIWTAAGSPHRLTSDVTVEQGATLTIEPGVLVCAAQDVGLHTDGGRLLADGTVELPIYFEPEQIDLGWKGIDLAGAYADSNFIRRAVVSGAGEAYSGWAAVGVSGDQRLVLEDVRIRRYPATGVRVGFGSGARLTRVSVDTTTWSDTGSRAFDLHATTLVESSVARMSGATAVYVSAWDVRLHGLLVDEAQGLGMYLDDGVTGLDLQDVAFLHGFGGIQWDIFYPNGLAPGAQAPEVRAESGLQFSGDIAAFAKLWPTPELQLRLGAGEDPHVRLSGRVASPGTDLVLSAVARLAWEVSSLRIGAGVTLRPEAGADLRFDGDGILFADGGRLDLQGTPDVPAFFRGVPHGDTSTPWGGLRFDGAATSTIVGARFFGAFTEDGAVHSAIETMGEHVVHLDGVRIARPGGLAVVIGGGDGSTIAHTQILSMGREGRGVVELQRGATVEGSEISSTGAGILVDTPADVVVHATAITNSLGAGVLLVQAGAGTKLDGNQFVGNSGPGVDNRTGHEVSALACWWGDPEGPLGPTGDGVAGAVTFVPFLTAPPAP